jgi:ATP-dependent Clp protease ATP-binding subunit ClpB
MVRELNDRLADRKITISLTPAAKTRIAEIGFDPAYGARPLRRALQKRIEDALAMRILKGEFPEGDRVTVGVDPKGGFTFTRSAS